MSTIEIKNGRYSNKFFEGTYELVRGFTFWNNTKQRDEQGKEGKVTILLNNKEKGIWVNPDDFVIIDDGVIQKIEEETDEDISLKIKKRFNVMDKMGDGVVNQNIRSLIISGAPGIGKTHELETKLKKAEKEGKIQFNMMKGKVSAFGLYMKLYENRHEDCVTVLDDIDVFSDEDVLNILKAALDTGESRWLSWNTASSWLEENEIPNHFEFMGSVVFITNMNVDRELEKSSKITPHLDALISRSIYLDLGVHSNKNIMIRVKDVISSTDMLTDRGIPLSGQVEIVNWMSENVSRLRNVSLRTALFIADFMKTDPDWQDIAEATLIKPGK